MTRYDAGRSVARLDRRQELVDRLVLGPERRYQVLEPLHRFDALLLGELVERRKIPERPTRGELSVLE